MINGLHDIRITSSEKRQEVHSSLATLRDVEDICEILNSIFGPNPKAKEKFSGWIQDPKYHVSTAVNEGKIIAVGASYINESPELSKYKVFGDLALDFLRNQKVGWFLTLAVLPQFRKRQIGQAIASKHAMWLKSQGVTCLVGSSWVTGSGDNSQHLFIKAGFKKLGESHEFLRNQLLGTGSLCSACGKGDCQCLSVLYGLKIE